MIALFGVVLYLILGIVAFSACEGETPVDPENKEVTYTVTVTCADNSPILNFLYVELRNGNGETVAEGGSATVQFDAV